VIKKLFFGDMNLSKNNIVWSVLSLFFISFSFYQYYDKNKLIFKLNNLNSKLGHLTQYYEARKNIEAKKAFTKNDEEIFANKPGR